MKEMRKGGENIINSMVQGDDTLLPRLFNPKSNHNLITNKFMQNPKLEL